MAMAGQIIALLLVFLTVSLEASAQEREANPAQLAEKLASSSKETRRQAAFELARLGKKAEPALAALVKALADRDPQVLFQVARALAGLGPTAEAAVPGLIKNLRSRDRQVSYRSAYALGQIGKAAAPELIKLLASSSSGDRAAAARSLSWIRPPPSAAVGPLIKALSDSEKTVSRNASEALGSYGKAAAPALAQALGGAKPATRRGAARALSLMGPGAGPAEAALTGALADDDAAVRSAAVSALSKLGLPAGKLVPLLMSRLEDPEAPVRSAAVQALSRQRPSDVARELASLLDGAEEDTVQAVALVAERLGSRARAVLPGLVAAAARIDELRPDTSLARAMSVFGDEAAAVLLKELSQEGISTEKAERLVLALGFTAGSSVGRLRAALGKGSTLERLGAAKALGEAAEAGKEALPELLAGLEDDEARVRAACIGSLAALGFPVKEYAGALLELIEDPDEKVRAAAVSAAGELDSDQQVKLLPILERSLADSSVEIRRAAAASLGSAGPALAKAAPALLAALKDSDPGVRALAARALGALGGDGAGLVRELPVLLKDKDQAVRRASVEALVGFSRGTDGAMGPLRALASSPKEDEALRVAAIGALMKTGDKATEAQDLLLSLFAKGPVKVRIASARALVVCRRDTGKVVAALAAGIGEKNADVRRAAVEAAGELGSEAEGAAPALFELLGDEYTRAMGFEALKKIQPRDVSLLRKALRHEDRYVRGFACSCLGKLGAGAKDALEDLRQAARTRSRTLRDLVRKTIKLIEDDLDRKR